MNIISACLYGHKCRYDGQSTSLPNLADYKNKYELLPVCPEVLGGLPIPRPQAKIDSGTGKDVLEGNARVIDENNKDVTDYFISGARKTLELAIAHNVKRAIFKSRSPSCGFGMVHNIRGLVPGNGVTAELLHSKGIEVITI